MEKELNEIAIYSSDDMESIANYMKEKCIEIAYNRIKYNDNTPFPNTQEIFINWYMEVMLPQYEPSNKGK